VLLNEDVLLSGALAGRESNISDEVGRRGAGPALETDGCSELHLHRGYDGVSDDRSRGRRCKVTCYDNHDPRRGRMSLLAVQKRR
jgi:hypothetical protein